MDRSWSEPIGPDLSPPVICLQSWGSRGNRHASGFGGLRVRVVICLVAVVLGCGAPVPTAAPSPTPLASATPMTPTGPPTAEVTPTAVVTPTAAVTPTAVATPTAAVSPTPGASPTPSAVPSPTSTPADAWVEASTISSDHYSEIAMVVDPTGVVHAAGALGGSIWYLTDSGGPWGRGRRGN